MQARSGLREGTRSPHRRTVALPPADGSHGDVPTLTTDLTTELRAFAAFGTNTVVGELEVDGLRVPTFTNEFWTAAQREGHSLHEVSYRACFKPSLPAFFVERLSRPGELVFDPFMGRGTTPLEAVLRGRRGGGNDVNPLARLLVRPRLDPPTLAAVIERIDALDLCFDGPVEDDLRVFFHETTLRELHALRALLLAAADGPPDRALDWIRMVAVNRLTGHSSGFFSVYTLPPNQAVSVEAQRKINDKRRQTPPIRCVRSILKKKSKTLLADCASLWRPDPASDVASSPLLCGPAADLAGLASGSVTLVVTSPPFLDVVQYADDNWLRCWFCGIDPKSVPITMARTVPLWQQAMAGAFAELHRVVRSGGHVAFEVGEVKGGKVRLEEAVLPVAAREGFAPLAVMIHAQEFTKTANCWGIDNNKHGTNTNRIVVLRRD